MTFREAAIFESPHDFLTLFWTPLGKAQERWQPPVSLCAIVPRWTLSGFYITAVPADGEPRYRCQVVPGVMWYERRLSILLGASLDPRVTDVRVTVQRGRKAARAFEITAGGGAHTRLQISGNLRRLPERLTLSMNFMQWKASGNLVALSECARGMVIGRPHMRYQPPTAAEDFPFGAACVALGWRSGRVSVPNEGLATGRLQIGIEGIRRVPDLAPLCGAR
jgi:hypothetical protein